MENNKEILITNINKVHTTEMGKERITKNLDLTCNDVVEWCKNQILNKNCIIERKGKNWYCTIASYIITVNAYNYCIITAHKI